MSVKDFDAYWAEQEEQRIEFKIFGKVETLPSSLPAKLVLKLARANKNHGNNANVKEEDNIDFAISLFGEDKVNEWCEQGMSINQLMDLFEWATEQYEELNKGIIEGNRKAPK